MTTNSKMTTTFEKLQEGVDGIDRQYKLALEVATRFHRFMDAGLDLYKPRCIIT